MCPLLNYVRLEETHPYSPHRPVNVWKPELGCDTEVVGHTIQVLLHYDVSCSIREGAFQLVCCVNRSDGLPYVQNLQNDSIYILAG